ncbi:MAG: ABC transporter ATP-binding protein, partial [Bacteroidales bacterium]|nr:ABC transporter ATP-binding protein [Bacteroidales bacterium]
FVNNHTKITFGTKIFELSVNNYVEIVNILRISQIYMRLPCQTALHNCILLNLIVPLSVMIQTSNLYFRYRNGSSPVFDNLNIQLEKGGIYGLLGENGVGKTTFLRLLAGLIFPKHGTVTVNGFTPKNRDPKFLSEIYYFPENLEVIDKNIIEYAKLYSPFYPTFSKEYFDYYISEFGVNTKAPVTTLSQGNKKKAAVSFALACNTPVLLLDEPTNGLDIPSKTIFRRVLSEAASSEKTIIISTHQVREVEDIINPIIVMEYNQILLNNSIDEIKQKFVDGTLPNNSVVENDKVNLETLFNMAVENKNMFKQTFVK